MTRLLPSNDPPNDLPIVTFSIAEIAAAKRAGFLTIHDNGVLTIQRPGEPIVQVHTPKKDRSRKKLTCSDLCDKTWETQGCPTGTCALNGSHAYPLDTRTYQCYIDGRGQLVGHS